MRPGGPSIGVFNASFALIVRPCRLRRAIALARQKNFRGAQKNAPLALNFFFFFFFFNFFIYFFIFAHLIHTSVHERLTHMSQTIYSHTTT